MSECKNIHTSLIKFVEEKLVDENMMQETINLDHPRAEINEWEMHEYNKLQYERILKILKGE